MFAGENGLFFMMRVCPTLGICREQGVGGNRNDAFVPAVTWGGEALEQMLSAGWSADIFVIGCI